MKHRALFLLLIPIFLICPFAAHGQAWSGIISTSRAIDWSAGGISSSIPSGSWTQCGTTIAPYGTSAAPQPATAINNALHACGSNQFVLLGAGTFYLSSAVVVSDYASEKSGVVLRGQGANATFLVFSGGVGGGCFNSTVSIEGDCQYVNGGEGTVCDWTAGYAPGSTVITLANCGTTTPAKGALSNLKVGSLLILDQLDEQTDTGTIWNCENSGSYAGGICAGTIQGGDSRTTGPCNGTTCDRSQQQGVIVTAISGSNITISPAIYMPNWRAGQKPQAWFASNIIKNSGLENLSIDMTNASSTANIAMGTCNGCWVKGVRSIKANRSHVRFDDAMHSILRDSYMFANQSGASVSYGAELQGAWNNLIENNIFQQITDSDPSCTGPCEGNVISYNFDVHNTYTASNSYIVPPFFQHASGDAYNLWEGNIGPGYAADNIHGTHHFETVYRNTLPGWQNSCTGGPCLAQTTPISLSAGSRYFNIIGNVLGQPGFHNSYTCAATISNTPCATSYQVGGKDTMIYKLNYVQGSYPSINGFCLSLLCNVFGNYDPQVATTLLRWGNYDVVNNSSQFNPSEVPTALASYSNPVPSTACTASVPCPNSLFYSLKPAWFGAAAWPIAGPDVSNGNLGVCSGGSYAGMAATSASQCSGGTLAAAWGSHANANPAMNCYLTVMNGPVDGTGAVLSFSAAACYAQQSNTLPSNLKTVVN